MVRYGVQYLWLTLYFTFERHPIVLSKCPYIPFAYQLIALHIAALTTCIRFWENSWKCWPILKLNFQGQIWFLWLPPPTHPSHRTSYWWLVVTYGYPNSWDLMDWNTMIPGTLNLTFHWINVISNKYNVITHLEVGSPPHMISYSWLVVTCSLSPPIEER